MASVCVLVVYMLSVSCLCSTCVRVHIINRSIYCMLWQSNLALNRIFSSPHPSFIHCTAHRREKKTQNLSFWKWNIHKKKWVAKLVHSHSEWYRKFIEICVSRFEQNKYRCCGGGSRQHTLAIHIAHVLRTHRTHDPFRSRC